LMSLAMLHGLAIFADTTATGPYEQHLAAVQARLIERDGPGTDKQLAELLTTMLAQYNVVAAKWLAASAASGTYTVSAQRLSQTPPTYQTLVKVALAQRACLKKIVADHGWPTIHLVGLEASDAALQILTDVADPAFQERML